MPYNKYQDRHMKCIEMHELKFLTIKQTYGIWDVSFGLWMQNAIPFFIGPSHRELKLDGAIGHFAEPLWRLKTGHFTT